MDEAIAKADVLIEALGWIRRFRDRITVIKLGGSVMQSAEAMRHLLLDVVFMETVGMRPVIVHGGGAAISYALRETGTESRFVHGRRYTDAATLEVVERVLAVELCESLVAQIEHLGGRAAPLNFNTTNVLFGRQAQIDDAAGKPLDLGFVGEVTRVDRRTIDNLCYAGSVPVIPSMCLGEIDPHGPSADSSEAGQKYNVNADTAALAVAQALGAEKLVYLSDVNGVRRDREDADSLIHSLTASEARELIADGTIDGGMIPKVEACLDTLDQGVGKVHIIDGRLRHSLLLEIYTSSGVGTQIVRDS